MMPRRKRRMSLAHIADSRVDARIHITPMIDVFLVLLILFLVIQPELQKGIDVQLPVDEAASTTSAPRDQIILRIDPGPRYAINDAPVAPGQLGESIREVFRDRPRKVLFVKGAETLSYAQVIRAVDIARGAGIVVVGLVPRQR